MNRFIVKPNKTVKEIMQITVDNSTWLTIACPSCTGVEQAEVFMCGVCYNRGMISGRQAAGMRS